MVRGRHASRHGGAGGLRLSDGHARHPVGCAQRCNRLPETLSISLGRLFEPYVVQILPFLLVAYGDGAPEVREAVHEASKAIMSKLR